MYFMDFKHFLGNRTPFVTTDPVGASGYSTTTPIVRKEIMSPPVHYHWRKFRSPESHTSAWPGSQKMFLSITSAPEVHKGILNWALWPFDGISASSASRAQYHSAMVTTATPGSAWVSHQPLVNQRLTGSFSCQRNIAEFCGMDISLEDFFAPVQGPSRSGCPVTWRIFAGHIRNVVNIPCSMMMKNGR